MLSGRLWDAYAGWHDRDPTYEPVANDVRQEILLRLKDLKSDVDRILRGDKIEPVQQKKATEAARLLLYGRDPDYRRQLNMSPGEVPPEPDLAAVGALIGNLINRIANMPVSDWRSKLEALRDDVDAG
jgi:hypothetical protein